MKIYQQTATVFYPKQRTHNHLFRNNISKFQQFAKIKLSTQKQPRTLAVALWFKNRSFAGSFTHHYCCPAVIISKKLSKCLAACVVRQPDDILN